MSSIKVIVVPANPEHPLRVEELVASDLDHMQTLVGGTIEVVNMANPPCSLYFNEDGQRLGLPDNERATRLLWVHRPEFLEETTIVGDAFITGSPDLQGDDNDAPEELIRLLFETENFALEYKLHEDDEDWVRSPGEHDDWQKAYAFAIEMLQRFSVLTAVRIVPAA